MKLSSAIESYRPFNAQEEADRLQMLQLMSGQDDLLVRENRTAHFTASMWTVNRARTKTLMVYHDLYRSWSWIGGHADGMEDLCAVAMKELREETGVLNARLVNEDIFSLEILTVSGHRKNGVWVPGHLHLNLTYLAEADEEEQLCVCEGENSAVQWWSLAEALQVSAEPWMTEHIYKKLIRKLSAGLDEKKEKVFYVSDQKLF